MASYQLRNLQDWPGALFIANITVGTPPQLFSVIFDNAGAPNFIPSVGCTEYFCKTGRYHFFNSSNSSTYSGLSDRNSYSSIYYAAYSYDGTWGKDVLHVGGAEMKDFEFLHFDRANCYSVGCLGEGFDGVLDLSPPWRESPPSSSNGHRNILGQFFETGGLEKNVFSLALPDMRKADSSFGELLVGSVDRDRYVGDLKTFEVVDITWDKHPSLSNLWSINITSVTFDSANPDPIRHNFSGPAMALVNTMAPWNLLPAGMLSQIAQTLKPNIYPCLMMEYCVPCDKIPEMPPLLFELGRDEDAVTFPILAEDYVTQIPTYMDVPICAISLGDVKRDYSLPEGIVVLGTPFLRRYYSVYNFENRTIGCKFHSISRVHETMCATY
jgi:saccharopepsin